MGKKSGHNISKVEREMAKSIAAQITELQSMNIRQLKAKWRQLYGGEEAPFKSKNLLWRRLAWRIQELKFGGLSEEAKQKVKSLIKDLELGVDLASQPPTGGDRSPDTGRVRDPRLPAPGTILTRPYNGQTLEVEVLEKGFRFRDQVHRSLSGLAKMISGSHTNGFTFFRLNRKGSRR